MSLSKTYYVAVFVCPDDHPARNVVANKCVVAEFDLAGLVSAFYPYAVFGTKKQAKAAAKAYNAVGIFAGCYEIVSVTEKELGWRQVNDCWEEV